MRLVRVPLLAGFAGGALVAVLVAALGIGSTTKTVTVYPAAPESASPAAARSTQGLTAAEIYKRAAPGVVFVRAQVVQRTQSPFDLFPTEQRGEATGSGFVIDRAGDILTNAHVIAGAVKVTVQFSNHKTVDAKVVGKDASSDLAVLRVPPDGLELRPLPLGSARDVQVGDPVVAIGNPFGLDRTLTTGVISALQRQISAPNGFKIDNVLQTDAPINPGNSGGPLIDAAGRVIGINSQIETGSSDGTGSTSGGNIGIGFAVPIDTARQALPQLERGQPVRHAWLGVETITIDGSLASLNLPVSSGALVQSVQRGSPADRAGINGGDVSADVDGESVMLGGDIIVSVDGRPVRTSDDLASVVAARKPGDELQVGLLSHGHKRTVTVRLGDRPNSLDTGAFQG